jgi:hypothetical protein
VDEPVNEMVVPDACGGGGPESAADVHVCTPSMKLVIAYDSYALGLEAVPSHTPTS